MNLYFNGPKSTFLQDRGLQAGWLPIDASYGSTLTMVPRIAKVAFGDGYEQRAPDGINTLPLIYDVSFLRRRREICQAVARFLAGADVVYTRQPYEFFWWTPPFPNDDRPLKFKCEKWTMNFEEFNAYTLNATFEQVFDPG